MASSFINQELTIADLPPVFQDFVAITTPYKTLPSGQITTTILIPKTLLLPSSSSTSSSSSPSSPTTTTTTTTTTKTSPKASPKAPVLLRLHGGGLVSGSSLNPTFFPVWYLEFAQRHSAIMVMPNYRLLPESSMTELLADIEDHWTWMHAQLGDLLATKTGGSVVVPDLDRIMLSGDSAGGYLSLMHALDHPDAIRSVAAAYPMVDVSGPHFTEDRDKDIRGQPQRPASDIDEHLARVSAGELPAAVWADAKLERFNLMFTMIQRGRFSEFFPAEERRLQPLARLEDGARLPRGGAVVWHGHDDTIVPAVGSVALERKIKEVDPGLPFQLVLRDGEHGFDEETLLDEEWIAAALKGIVAAWLA